MFELTADKKKTGEFYTPDKLAAFMADLLFEGFDPAKDEEPKVLDPSCGQGQLLVAVYLKLFQIYSHFWSDKEKLKMHIAENMIYGMDIDIDGIEISKSRIFEISGIQSSNFICSDFLFNENFKERFTHIIGNPPYIGHKNLELGYKKRLKDAFPGIYENKTDILSCFFPSAVKLLIENGRVVFITSRYYIEAPTYKGLRIFLKENCTIERIIDFDYKNIFKEARVASCISILRKTESICNSVAYDRFEENKNENDVFEIEGFGDFYRIKSPQALLDPKGWSFPTGEESKIRRLIEKKANFTLTDIFKSYQGIITGCDKAFVIKQEYETHGWNKRELALLRPWIKNSSVEKYLIKGQNFKLIYSDGIQNISEYPNIEKRLSVYREKLENRRETKKNIRKWYQLQWGRIEEVFARRKIVHPYKASGNRFAIDDNGNFCSADVYLMVPKAGFEPYLEYLTAVLNSDIYDAYFKSFGKRMGGKIFDYYPNKVMEMKVYIPEDIIETLEIRKLYKEFVKLVEADESEAEELEELQEKINNEIKKSLG